MSLVATDITRELITLLGYCTTANGYTSNVGATVKLGQTRGAYQQAPAVFVLPGRQSGAVRYAGDREVTRQYEVRGFADLNDHPTLDEAELVDLVIWDLRRCIETYEPALDALLERLRYVSDTPGYPEDGGSLCGAALTYEVTYSVNINDPETAA